VGRNTNNANKPKMATPHSALVEFPLWWLESGNEKRSGAVRDCAAISQTFATKKEPIMRAHSAILFIVAACLALCSCGRDSSMSGTIQRVTLAQGMVLLELSSDEILMAEPASLVDNTDLLVGVANDRPIAAFFEAIQSWKGRYVTCTGETKIIDGKRYGVIKRDRSNLSVR